MVSIWNKIREKLGYENKSIRASQEEDLDFLDSSASERLKQSCRKLFSSDQMDEFENYAILEEIGRGNMGIVYKALHNEENKIYALKVLPKNVINNPQAIAQFFQEICVHKQLSHPNIIYFYKIGVSAQTVFIVMEYVLGNDLDTLMRQQGQFNAQQALEIILPIVEAIGYAHKMGIVHRDLKPANILIENATRSPKIADFGMAQLSSDRAAKDHSFGTPAYMAPEQIVSSKVDIRADIYALGSILYHMLSGKRPYYEIHDPVFLLRTKVKQDAQDISILVPGLPNELKTLVTTAMARDPNRRYSTPGVLLKEAQVALANIKERIPRKTYQRPSEQLRAEAILQSTAFLPHLEEVPDLFMTASRCEIEPAVHTFQREIMAFKNSPVGSLLKEPQEEEEDEKFEETLLTVTMAQGTALHIPQELEKLMTGAVKTVRLNNKKNLLEKVVALLGIENSAEYKSTLMELRYLFLLRGNLLCKQKSLIEFLNNNPEYLNFKLEEMSRISQSESFNRGVYKYFQQLIEGCLKSYVDIFYRDLLACKNSHDVGCYLQNYTLLPKSLLHRYKNLSIIEKIKTVHVELEENPEQTEQICRQHFKPQEDQIRKFFLAQYLKQCKEGPENAFWVVVNRSHNLAILMKHLWRLQEKSEFKTIVGRVNSLIEVFLDSGGRTSLDQLKTSLNFIPQPLQERICSLVRKQLNIELENKIRELLTAVEEKRFKSFLSLLQNPRYHSSGIKLYGYPVKVLAGKILQLHNHDESIEEVFHDKTIPNEILALVLEDRQMEVAARACTFQNCLQEIKQLKKQSESRQPTSLLKPIVNIMYRYGKINFAKDNTIYAINGYHLSRYVLRFYNDPNKTHLELPEDVNQEISDLIAKMVNRERERHRC